MKRTMLYTVGGAYTGRSETIEMFSRTKETPTYHRASMKFLAAMIGDVKASVAGLTQATQVGNFEELGLGGSVLLFLQGRQLSGRVLASLLSVI